MKGKILLTGYEPFLDMKKNPSMEAIRLLDGMVYNGYEVVVEELPMKYAEVRDIIRGFVDIHQPAAVICTGVSSIATDIPVERIAINVGSAEGRVNIKEAGIPAHISNSAGTQGCNLVFYHLMDYIAEKNLRIPGGFIHVPRLPENAVGSRNPSMSLLDSAKALEIAANVMASKLP